MTTIQRVLVYSYLIFSLQLNNAYQNCFEESNDINYLFVNDMSQIKIPLVPLDCLHCQSAYQVSRSNSNASASSVFRYNQRKSLG